MVIRVSSIFYQETKESWDSERCRVGEDGGNPHLNERKVPFGELNEDFLSTKSIVKLDLEILDLLFCNMQDYEDGLVGV